jgi:hypothetical protein
MIVSLSPPFYPTWYTLRSPLSISFPSPTPSTSLRCCHVPLSSLEVLSSLSRHLYLPLFHPHTALSPSRDLIGYLPSYLIAIKCRNEHHNARPKATPTTPFLSPLSSSVLPLLVGCRPFLPLYFIYCICNCTIEVFFLFSPSHPLIPSRPLVLMSSCPHVLMSSCPHVLSSCRSLILVLSSLSSHPCPFILVLSSLSFHPCPLLLVLSSLSSRPCPPSFLSFLSLSFPLIPSHSLSFPLIPSPSHPPINPHPHTNPNNPHSPHSTPSSTNTPISPVSSSSPLSPLSLPFYSAPSHHIPLFHYRNGP